MVFGLGCFTEDTFQDGCMFRGNSNLVCLYCNSVLSCSGTEDFMVDIVGWDNFSCEVVPLSLEVVLVSAFVSSSSKSNHVQISSIFF